MHTIQSGNVSIFELIVVSGIIVSAVIVFFLYLYLRNKINPFKRASRLFVKGNFDKTLLLLAVELEKNPANRRALLLKADTEAEQKQYEEAVKDYFRLISLKKPGDEIDTFEVKKRLLKPLYRLESLLELHSICREILKLERNNPEALYYLSLLYIGQLYYRDAANILQNLVHNRPRMHQALFVYAVTLIQEKKFDLALEYIGKARDVGDCTLYRLVLSAVYCLKEDYLRALTLLKSVPRHEGAFAYGKQYLFMLRLKAFCNYKLGRYSEAVNTFRLLYEKYRRRAYQKEPETPKIELYNEFGTIRASLQDGGKKSEPAASSVFEGYYKLKEVAMEEGQRKMLRDFPTIPSNRILDLEGLSSETAAAVDLGFSMVRAGNLSDSCSFLEKVRSEHPEVLGLKRVINLIEERGKNTALADESDIKGRIESRERISTQRIVKRKKRRYELWEYMDEWEKNAIKPYQILIISRFTSRRHLSPAVLFGNGKKFELDI